MRHRMRTSQLGRTSAHRHALYRNLVTSLLEHERIETTDTKAKQLRRLADRMITLGKRGTLHARRRALRVIRSREVASKVFGDLAERYRDRAGGYTRVLKLRQRPGDNATISLVELVDSATAPAAAAKGGRAKGAGAAAAKAGEKRGRATKADKAARDERKAEKKAAKAAARAAVKTKLAPQKPAPKTQGRGRRGDS